VGNRHEEFLCLLTQVVLDEVNANGDDMILVQIVRALNPAGRKGRAFLMNDVVLEAFGKKSTRSS
jgi:hypothetical protein